MAHSLEKAQTAKRPAGEPRRRPRVRAADVAGSRGAAAGSKNIFTMGENSGKISVREAKEITRRIIERVKRRVTKMVAPNIRRRRRAAARRREEAAAEAAAEEAVVEEAVVEEAVAAAVVEEAVVSAPGDTAARKRAAPKKTSRKTKKG